MSFCFKVTHPQSQMQLNSWVIVNYHIIDILRITYYLILTSNIYICNYYCGLKAIVFVCRCTACSVPDVFSFHFRILDCTLRFNVCQEPVELDILPVVLLSFPCQNQLIFLFGLGGMGDMLQEKEFYFHDKISSNLY